MEDEPAIGTTAIQELTQQCLRDEAEKRQEVFDRVYDRLGKEGLAAVAVEYGKEAHVDVSQCKVLTRATIASTSS